MNLDLARGIVAVVGVAPEIRVVRGWLPIVLFSILDFRFSVLSTIHYPLSTIHSPLSTIRHPLPSSTRSTRRARAAAHCPAFDSRFYPLSTLHSPLSTMPYPLSTIHYRVAPEVRVVRGWLPIVLFSVLGSSAPQQPAPYTLNQSTPYTRNQPRSFTLTKP